MHALSWQVADPAAAVAAAADAAAADAAVAVAAADAVDDDTCGANSKPSK